MTVVQVIVAGAGLGGLAAAISIQSEHYQVLVVESAAELSEIGAGLQITAQSVNVFRKWGIAEELEPTAAKPKTFTLLRYSDGKVLAHDDDWSGWMEKEFGACVWDLHRADLQKVMYRKAKELGVQFRFGARIASIDCKKAVIKLKNGEDLTADLIIGADGLHSVFRESILGRADPALPTGDLAYRIVLNRDEVQDPALLKMMVEPAVRLYAGPKAHTIMYSLKGGHQLNIVLLVPDDLPDNVRKAPGSTDEMNALFADWHEPLRQYLSLVKDVDKWRLMHHPGLESWHHESGKVVMLGDAVHPMLPYLAQGANSAIEDGVVLGECLKRVNSTQDLKKAITVFERLRKPRSEQVVALTHQQRHWNHLEDGPEQEERDALIEKLGPRTEDFPSAWINSKLWSFLNGYDPYHDVKQNWERLYAQA